MPAYIPPQLASPNAAMVDIMHTHMIALVRSDQQLLNAFNQHGQGKVKAGSNQA